MCDEWMPTLRLPLTGEQYRQLPRNASYRYDYLDGVAILSPNARHFHAVLDLEAARPALEAEAATAWAIRPVEPAELGHLVPAFAAAFRTVQPFGSLTDDARREAAAVALERTRSGRDGPWVGPACLVALDPDGGPFVGGLLVTLLPGGDPADSDSYYWSDPPEPDLVARAGGWPHLTWVFVSPLCTGRGLGTALLAAAVRQLRALGYRELASTFLAGNDSSLLWHWRCGFRLLPCETSRRRLRQRWTGRP
jgi:GNAT superfamily N-acetyltransferase